MRIRRFAPNGFIPGVLYSKLVVGFWGRGSGFLAADELPQIGLMNFCPKKNPISPHFFNTVSAMGMGLLLVLLLPVSFIGICGPVIDYEYFLVKVN